MRAISGLLAKNLSREGKPQNTSGFLIQRKVHSLYVHAPPQTGYAIQGVHRSTGRPMPKQKTPEAITFGERLLALRKAAALTQQQLADGVDPVRWTVLSL
jgi:hypothetical protein